MNWLPPEDMARRDQRIAELTRAGRSASQIAAELHVTARTVARARARMGIAKPCRITLTDDELRRAAALLEDGASYAEVARTLGRSIAAICKRFPGRSAWKQGSGYEARCLNQALDAIKVSP